MLPTYAQTPPCPRRSRHTPCGCCVCRQATKSAWWTVWAACSAPSSPSLTPKHCVVEVLDELPATRQRNYRLHLAIAPTKNIDRMEWCIEKATEIGVDEITPFVGQFSERRMVKPERLERIIVSAAKQSLKSRFPVLHPLCPFHELLDCPASQRFIAHCYPGEKPLLQHACHPGGDVLVLIGPEGDFSPDEVQRALACGFQPVSLGTSRLRTETAGVVAVATVQLVNN